MSPNSALKGTLASTWIRGRLRFTLKAVDTLDANKVRHILDSWKLPFEEERVEGLVLEIVELSTQKSKTLTGFEEIEQFFKHLVARYNAFLRAENEASRHE
jgi:hypothetical protein